MQAWGPRGPAVAPSHGGAPHVRNAPAQQQGQASSGRPAYQQRFSDGRAGPQEHQRRHRAQGDAGGQQRRPRPAASQREQQLQAPDAQGERQEERPYRVVLKQHGVGTSAVAKQQSQHATPTGLSLTFLGTSSGAPTLERNVSCTALQLGLPTGFAAAAARRAARPPPADSVAAAAAGALEEHEVLLVDCGEGSHRQLPVAGIPLAKVSNIHITHLHGDHCYGLGSVLLAIDQAKQLQQQLDDGAHARQDGEEDEDAEPVTYVWGPPGLGDLLTAQLVTTGAHRRLSHHVVVTELVTTPGPDPAAAAGAATPMQPLGPQGASGAPAAPPRLWIRHLAPRRLADLASDLQAAAQAARLRLDRIPAVWRPHPAALRHAGARPTDLPSAAHSPTTSSAGTAMSDDEAEATYGGRLYLALEGVVWDLQPPPPPGTAAARAQAGRRRVRCLAAQLQHRVPCWGYAFQEVGAALPGVRPRKVVVMGDTVSSRPMAPLAWGCDVLAHEATFMEGMEDKCRVAQHSTAWMAGAFAHAVQAQLLVLTHFSARYARTGEPIRPSQPGQRPGRVEQHHQGAYRERELSAEEEAQQQAQAISCLVSEAQAQHVCGAVQAACDFTCVHVPLQRAGAALPAAAAAQHQQRLRQQQQYQRQQAWREGGGGREEGGRPMVEALPQSLMSML